MLRPSDMLQRLSPPVRPVAARSEPRRPIDKAGFGELLDLFTHGRLESDAPLVNRLSAQADLSEAQWERLRSAADQASGAGFTRALLLVDGRGFVLDVPDRSLELELGIESGARIVDVDGAVYVAAEAARERGAVNPALLLARPLPGARGRPDPA